MTLWFLMTILCSAAAVAISYPLIRRYDARFESMCLRDFGSQAMKPVTASRYQRHVHPKRRQLSRERLADSIGRACDDRPATISAYKGFSIHLPVS